MRYESIAALLILGVTVTTEAPAQGDPAESAPTTPPDEATPAPSTSAPTTPIAPPPRAAPAPDPPPLALPPPEPSAPAPKPWIPPTTPPEPAPATDVSAPDGVDAQLYGGIVISGVGAALLVVAGIAVSRIGQLEDDPGYDAYREGFEEFEDVCERADAGATVPGAASPAEVQDICSEASRWEITSYVAVPGGIAMLGMGLYLALSSDTAQIESPVSVVPTIGPSTAGLTMTGRF